MGNRVFCSGHMCPKAVAQPAGENELFDDTSACDPAGTVFNETLEDLNEVDRLFVIFCSSANLSAVRWLRTLGANLDACDTNGTTCLHAACRSGSLSVVRELIRWELPLDPADVAGWTPLHVAFFMGRRGVAFELMKAGADLTPRNTHGLTPSELCSDVWLREAIHSCATHRSNEGQISWEFGKDNDISEDIQISSRLRFEPFFVPRAPVCKDLRRQGALQTLGVQIFNQRPGQGLAFLVSAGIVRDFPVELSTFLTENSVSLSQVGEFLGEDFSLSQTLRLEFVNSVRLMGTGVLSALAKVFQQFHIPSEMQKLDRLVDGIAQIWWRQHEQLREKDSRRDFPPVEDQVGGEVEGLRLMQYIENHDILHRLMFSVLMLHWNLYAPLPPSQRISRAQWLQITAEASDRPARADRWAEQGLLHVRRLLYEAVEHTFYPQLQIWASRMPLNTRSAIANLLSSVDELIAEDQVAGEGEAVALPVDGWAILVGGGFPSFAGSSGTITYRHIRSILSETTSTGITLASPNVSRQDPEATAAGGVAGRSGRLSGGGQLPRPTSLISADPSTSSPIAPVGALPATSSGMPGEDWAWFTLKEGLLFLAPKPTHWAPYAYVHLRGVIVQAVDTSTCTITLGADSSMQLAEARDPRLRQVGLRCNGGFPHSTKVPGDDGPLLQLIFLLPDGRWQLLELARLGLQLPDERQLERWRHALHAHCTFAQYPQLSDDGEAGKVVGAVSCKDENFWGNKPDI
mmetsp:Transcript_6115/g.14201  ORF Transcript_6115/g.14201 Transcript_6115/m.14201 type:complete len:746 (-) Transcript_6115:57-2294(-)